MSNTVIYRDMKRTEKVSTSLTEDEKRRFRILAAERDMDMAELLRELVYDEIEREGYETTRNPGANLRPTADR